VGVGADLASTTWQAAKPKLHKTKKKGICFMPPTIRQKGPGP
jgi:hypothetical protein